MIEGLLLHTNSTVTTTILQETTGWSFLGASLTDWITAITAVAISVFAAVTVWEGARNRRKDTILKQLDGLYNPLYVLVKYLESISPDKKAGLTYLAYGIDKEEINRGKKRLDEIILKGCYLADDKELEDLLPRVVGAGFYQPANKDAGDRITKLIISGYERLRKEYLSL